MLFESTLSSLLDEKVSFGMAVTMWFGAFHVGRPEYVLRGIRNCPGVRRTKSCFSCDRKCLGKMNFYIHWRTVNRMAAWGVARLPTVSHTTSLCNGFLFLYKPHHILRSFGVLLSPPLLPQPRHGVAT